MGRESNAMYLDTKFEFGSN